MALAAAAAATANPVLDVRHRASHKSSDDSEVKDIFAYGAGLCSTNAIVGLSDFTHLQTLSLHGNQIECIEGLEVLTHLQHLNLSSNRIAWMEGLSHLHHLRILNLSNNRIQEIAGLTGLLALKTLILSHNQIHLLGGLSSLQGPPYALQHLDLRDNCVEYVCELWILGGCSHLEELVFQCGGYTNPVCQASAYRSTLLSLIPNLQSLDGSSSVAIQAPANPHLQLSAAVPSLWAIHHSYPALQTPGPPQPSQVPQDHHSRPYSASNHCKSPRRNFQGRRQNESTDSKIQAAHPEQHEYSESSVEYCAKPMDHVFQQGARGNAEDLITVDDAAVPLWKQETSSEAPDNSRYVRFVGKSSTKSTLTSSPHLRRLTGALVQTPVETCEKNTNVEMDVVLTSGLVETPGTARFKNIVAVSDHIVNAMKSFWCPCYLFSIVREHQDQTTQTTRELATQTESVQSGPVLDQVPQEVNHLQSNLSTITVVIDGNASYSAIGKQNVLANLELYKKDNELLHLTKEKKLIEDEFKRLLEAFPKHERNHIVHVGDNHKSMALQSLETNLKGCKLELHNLRKTVTQTEKELMTDVKHVESSIIKHIVLDDAIKLSAMSAEILALKEALNSALNTCQTVGTALNDANHQKEKAKRTLVSLTAALDEQRSKVKIVTEMLENCTHQERRSRKECNRLSSELVLVRQAMRKNKDRETEDLIEAQSALWQARGREELEKLWQQWADELHRQLVNTQTLICQVLQENAKALSSVSKLRDTMIEKMLELRNALEAVMEKERGAKELITELSFVVSAQKKRSEWMQLELDRLAASKQAVNQEVERLQAEIVKLQERSSATEQKAERERQSIEEASHARFSSLLIENEKLAARASSLTQKLQETHNIIMARTEVWDRQETLIEQLKEELVEAKNAACVSEANINAVEADLVQRLQYEVEQKCELRNELTFQETIISEMEEELRISNSAKYGADQACKSLQEKINNVDLMLRHVDEEINGVKTLYEGREKTILLERDDALAKVIAMQKKLEDAEVATTASMKAHFESTKLMEAKEQKVNTTLIQKDIHIENLKRKVLEVETELHSRNLALETQKAISSAKVEQLGKVLEELREVT